MKKIILVVIVFVILITATIMLFSEEIQRKLDEQEVYPCECCIKNDSTQVQK